MEEEGRQRRVLLDVTAEAADSDKEEDKVDHSMAAATDLSDVEELRQVLKAISEFLRDLREPLRDLLNAITQALDGGRLGEDVARFYRSLRESGMPEDMAAELTRQYFRERLEAANIAGLVARFLRREALEKRQQAPR